MRAWTLKKICEYLGEEEHTLTDFILTKLHRKCQPTELLTGTLQLSNFDFSFHILVHVGN